jgi:hypothetical protein
VPEQERPDTQVNVEQEEGGGDVNVTQETPDDGDDNGGDGGDSEGSRARVDVHVHEQPLAGHTREQTRAARRIEEKLEGK